MKQREGRLEGQTGQMQTRRSLGKILIRAAIAFVLLLSAVVTTLHVSRVQKRIIEALSHQVENSAGLGVELESFRWAPLTGLDVVGLKIHHAGRIILVCEKVRITFGSSRELPYLRPKAFYMEKPILHLQKGRNGGWRIPETGGGDDPSGDSADSNRLWNDTFHWPELHIQSGQIVAEQDGKRILTVKDVTGVLVPEVERNSGLPVLKLYGAGK